MRALYAVAYPAGLADSAEEEFDETDTLNEDVESETDEDVTSDHLERVVALRGRSHERSVEYRPQARAISEDSTEASNTNSLREGELNRGRPVALALRPALGSAISTSTSAHNNMFSRSHSRGRPMDRIGPAPIRPVTRTSPSAAQAASLRRRRTRSGREGGTRPRSSDGCIVVAASDETVRFHEVWSDTRRGIVGWRGVLGGSDILEGLEGIEKDGGECIR